MGLFDRHQSIATDPAPRREGYDRIAVAGVDGSTRLLTRAEFEKLPLLDRVQLLAGGRLQFFRGDEQVKSTEAMRSV